MRNAAGELNHFQAALDVAVAVGHRLAVLCRQQLGKRLLFLLHEIEKTEQHAGALLRVLRRPIGLGSRGIGDCRFRFRLGGQSDPGLNLAQCRVPHIGRAAAFARHRLATDEMTNIRYAIARHVSPLKMPMWFVAWIMPGAPCVQICFSTGGSAGRVGASPCIIQIKSVTKFIDAIYRFFRPISRKSCSFETIPAIWWNDSVKKKFSGGPSGDAQGKGVAGRRDQDAETAGRSEQAHGPSGRPIAGGPGNIGGPSTKAADGEANRVLRPGPCSKPVAAIQFRCTWPFAEASGLFFCDHEKRSAGLDSVYPVAICLLDISVENMLDR